MDQIEGQLTLLLSIDLDYFFDQAVNLYWRELMAIAMSSTRHVEEAEDLVQEAFVHAFFALDRYPAERIRALHLRPWLYTILKNLCRNQARRKFQQDISYSLTEIPYELEIDEQYLPERLVEYAEMKRETETLVSQLPSPYRDSIYLYYFENRSYQEIANFLHIPIGTVRSHLFRGKKLLHQKLTALIDEER